MCNCRTADAQRGVTLVELVAMIVVVSVISVLAAGAIGNLGLQSAEPLVQRQSLAIAETFLAEVLQQGTADNDPDGGADNLGPETGETRGSGTLPFDHVNDYDGYTSSGITTLDGTAIAGLASYSVRVTVRAQAIDNVGSADGWWIEVAVTAPDGQQLKLSGWRARLSG